MQARNNAKDNSLNDQPFTLVENTQQGQGCADYAHLPSWNFEIAASNKTIPLTLVANHDEASLSDLVPIAHQLCDMITKLTIENEKENGEEVACKKGCASCCSYMVSVSSAEAFYLQKYIFSMSAEKRKSILHSFMKAARKIAANHIPSLSNAQSEAETLKAISSWYQKLNIKCPLLKDNACSLYQTRPMACREHLVTSSPKSCNSASSLLTSVVEMPFSAAETLMHISNSVESTIDEAVIMPLAMIWCKSNTKRAEKKYPATLLAEILINEISKKVPAMV